MWMSKSGLKARLRADNMVSREEENQIFWIFEAPGNDGGPDWTRTSDPTLIKRVL